MAVLYVSPSGQDSNEGTANFPFATLTYAVQQSRPGNVIQLAPGTYQANERFPIVVPAGVTVAGDGSRLVTISGGGASGNRNVAVVLGDRAQLKDTTITNPQGSGLVAIDGTPLIIRNRFIGCPQYGAIVTGSAHPFFSENEFIDSAATGLVMVDQAKGEVRQNQFARMGEGISVRSQSAPLIIGNQFADNKTAIVIAGFAKPVLRQNKVTGSKDTGLRIQDRAQPDIGQPQDLGDNSFEGRRYDLFNDASETVVTAGNRLNPVRVGGSIRYVSSEVPDDAAVPTVLLGQVEPAPPLPEAPTDVPTREDTPSLDSRFNDLVGHWSAPFVEALAEKNLVKGFIDGTFQPDDQVTRAQFAALIAAAFPDQDAVREGRRFSDVSASFWATRAIRHAQTRGFISGFPDGSFRPNAPLTKVQAIVALVSGLALGDGRSESLLIYRDRAQVPSYAIEPVASATARQLIVNYPDPHQLNPLVPATRAETTALVHQALVLANKTSRIPSPFIPEAEAALPYFADLSRRHWATEYIDPLVEQGWLSGFRDGTFRPDSPMTRAQFAVLLVGAFDPPPKRPAISFRDVPQSFWGAAVIEQAYRAGFISGFPDLTFDPNFPLTKLQALLALVSGLSLQTVSPPRVRSLNTYSDRSAIPTYAKDAIASATQLSLVFNHPIVTELRPNRTATRAEVSAMVYQALVIADRMPAVASRYQVSAPA